ncbi:UvrY/SirA/GacA family response regulator transcription factor [Aliiglaciecola lipolytica]|uniref:Two-component system, NarL family, invasion response regulator UvrY n=1 Tax=Aliiglaciecola lipolytica E3 TaxID=1127673 RepID=K6WX18_9ALTE|nr:UvrY/SirA/GacA family response regulator transcription factor [Aliiglaciecola lipolytica]GAC12994.1 two-component system, NarL family, invasion response regulator UvrY [Aliiglaciecola lipolytica E3]
MITLLLVDDHELVRTGIRRILEDISDFKVVGEVNNGEEAIKFCRNSPPDIVLMDMNMPGIGGLEATKQIIHFCQDAKVVVVSVHTENPIPARVMQLGAYGYLTKGTDPNEMVIAIRKVASGQRYIAPEIAQQIAIGQLNLNEVNPFEQLSRRELEITIMLTKGNRVPDIANKLNISAKTVNTYRYRMFDKLKVGSDVELTHLALRHNLIDSNQL